MILIVGVNGSGKTTSIAKLAHRWQKQGRQVLLAAADTYRAAAVEQLDIWAKRVGVPIVKEPEGGDPGAVVTDAHTITEILITEYVTYDCPTRADLFTIPQNS